MSSYEISKKHIAILSDDLVVFDALSDNSAYLIQLLDSNYIQSINDISKIDLLIIDKNLTNNKIPFYRINSVINLSNQLIVKSEICFHKPLKLQKLLHVISSNMQDEYLFCCINGNWVYSQRLAKINSATEEILFTDKENAIFSELLVSKDFLTSKDSLKNKIWEYHKDSQSMTVDTHLYKLKQKLPDDLLEVRATQCCLNINNLV